MHSIDEAAGGASTPPTWNAQLIIDLTQSGLPSDTPVYIYCAGQVGDTFYYLDSSFMPQVMALADNTIAAGTFPGMDQLSTAAQQTLAASYPSAWADWSIQVEVGTTLVLCLGNINTANIPGLGTGTSAFSGRVYFSVGIPKLPFTVQSSGYTQPVFGNGTGVPGSLTLFDWIEFSYDSEGNFNGNTSQENQFGFPLMLTGYPLNGQTQPVQGMYDTPRADILDTIAAGAAPFWGSGIVVPVPAGCEAAYPSNTGYLRAISPVSISGIPPSQNTLSTELNAYFDTLITTAYQGWQSTPIVVTDVATGSYTGVVFPVQGADITTPTDYPTGSLAFYPGSFQTMADLAQALNSSNPPAVGFYLTGSSSNLITSNDIWQCANSLATGSTAQLNVGKNLAAAFNRGLVVSPDGSVVTSLNDGTCAQSASTFYPEGGTFNAWAMAFHTWNKNGLAYAFPYDDVCDQNPTIPPPGQSLVAQAVRITLGGFWN